jgi:hypothetical protein
MSAVETITRQIFDHELDERLEEHDVDDFTGWFCIETAAWPCPAPSCGFIAEHITAAHRIVVWPTQDDPWMLSFALDASNLGRKPRIVEYQRSEGPCIAYDQWCALGKPVHGVAARPDGTGFRRL